MDEALITKQLPHSLEAEQAVLGSMLIDADCVKDVMDQLRPEDFHLRQNREIFETIHSMFIYSKPIDGVTVAGEMEKNGLYNDNTRPYLLQLMEVTPTSANVMEYARIVREKALMRSADLSPEEYQEEPSKLDKWLEAHVSAEKLQSVLVVFTVILSLGMTLGLFMLLPTFLAGLVSRYFDSALLHNVIEGVVKIAIFFAYLILCSKQKDIYRVFQYHGAEHKTIFCYEQGLELTVENVRKQQRFHPRCGTSFLLIVLVLSILVSSVITWENMLLRVLLKILLLPITVGISYEIIKFAGRHDNWLTRIISAPGLWFQNFTTQEPDDSMIEIAIAAVKPVLPENPEDARF